MKSDSRVCRNTVLYGTDQPAVVPQLLVAGALSVELEAGNLRRVAYQGREVLRGIAFLVRDRNWATATPVLRGLHIEETEDAFAITYCATVAEGGQYLTYAAQIRGQGNGALDFTCNVEIGTKFVANRIGFVILHPVHGVAGCPVEVEHADGTRTSCGFPRLIDPVQPILNIRALTHAVADGLWATCRMEGDVFEMEDQRNWTDASFKTYVRPLSRPWPFTLSAGEMFRQSVSLRFTGHGAPAVQAGIDPPVAVIPGEVVGRMPLVGLGCRPADAAAALPHVERLRMLGVQRLVCRLDPADNYGTADLERFHELATRMAAAIELQLVVASVDRHEEEIAAVGKAVHLAGVTPVAVMVSPATDLKSTPPGRPWPKAPPLAELYRAARAAFPGALLGGGMFSHFTELNRKRPPTDLLDFITFSTSAIVHASDDRSVMESLEALPFIAESARTIAGGKSFAVGPSAIGTWDNPNGPAPLPNPRNMRLAMSGWDPRQRGLFNAAWTLGYLARFAAGGAERVALSAPWGDFGVIGPEGPYPVFPILRSVSAMAGADLHATRTTGDDRVVALHVSRPGRSVLWLANLTNDGVGVELPPPFQGWAVRVLDATSLENRNIAPDGMASLPAGRAGRQVRLDAYAVAELYPDGSSAM